MPYFLISRRKRNKANPAPVMPHKIFSISSFRAEREGCLYPGYDRFQKQIVRGHCNLQWKESYVSHAKGDPCVPAQPQSTDDDLPVATPHSRSSWNCNIWYVKPFPSSPMRFLLGTLTSSKKIWAVSDDLMPSLSIFLVTWMPEEKGVLERPQKIGALRTSTAF